MSHVCAKAAEAVYDGEHTVVDGVSAAVQTPQLLQASVQHPTSVARNRQSERLPVCSRRPAALLAPVGESETCKSSFFTRQNTIHSNKSFDLIRKEEQ